MVGFASAVLLFLSITTFGGYVLTGVVEEKSTGVVEVLLSHMKPHQLLGGKVFGSAPSPWCSSRRRCWPASCRCGSPGPTCRPNYGSVSRRRSCGSSAGSSCTARCSPSPVRSCPGWRTPRAPPPDHDRVHARLHPGVHVRWRPRGRGRQGAVDPAAVRTTADAAADGHRRGSVVEIVVAAVLLALAVWAMIRLAGTVYSRTLLHRGSRLTWRQALLRRPAVSAR